MPAWTTKDYFDPFPGIAAGMAGARLSEDVSARREASKERAVDRASADRRYADEQRFRQAQTLAQWGVEPVIGPDGTPDWNATARAANAKLEMAKNAESLGAAHGWAGGPTSLTQQEYALSQTPEYQRAYRSAATLRSQQEAQRAAQLEQIAARGQAQLAVAEERSTKGPSAYATKTLPDGTVVRMPITSEDAKSMTGDSTGNQPDKIEQAIEKATRLKEAGIPFNLGNDSEGFPTITKGSSWWFHDAGPDKPGSADAVIQQLERKRKNPKGATPPPAANSEKLVPVWDMKDLLK